MLIIAENEEHFVGAVSLDIERKKREEAAKMREETEKMQEGTLKYEAQLAAFRRSAYQPTKRSYTESIAFTYNIFRLHVKSFLTRLYLDLNRLD